MPDDRTLDDEIKSDDEFELDLSEAILLELNTDELETRSAEFLLTTTDDEPAVEPPPPPPQPLKIAPTITISAASRQHLNEKNAAAVDPI